MSVTDNQLGNGDPFIWRNAPPRKCRRCELDIPDSEVAGRLPRGKGLGCSGCYPKAVKRIKPCEACGRKISQHRFCTWRCENHYYNAPAAARRKAQRLEARLGMTCTQCGESFTPKRRDAKTCSPACKQKAYRERNRNR
jgi:hypothetical protein